MNVLIATFAITSCSVYKSQGRKNFEGRVVDRMKSGNIGLGLRNVGSCWIQPATDPLWSKPTSQLIVRQIPEPINDMIEVCVQNANIDSDPHNIPLAQ